MTKLKKASISNHDAMLRELRADPEYAAEFVKVAQEEVEDPETFAAALLALRTVAEAYGMAKVQKKRASSVGACTAPSRPAATRH